MRAALVAALLASPTALAFATGGFPDGPRAWAGLVAWLLVAAAVAGGARLPRSRPALLALGGLSGLAAWTLLSALWAPVAGAAWDGAQLAVLYLGALTAAALLARGGARRLVEPAVAAGALVVVGYGLAERLLPGVLEYARSQTAEGRLEQPLTYWNAMGLLAATGVVAAARLAGDERRPGALRAAAAAATVPLGLGLALTVSRGALFALAAGLLTLVVATRRREQLEAVLLAVAAGGLAALAAQPFDGVTSLAGTAAARERDGAVVLGAIVMLAALAAAAQRATATRAAGPLRLPRGSAAAVAAGLVAAFALALVAGGDERAGRPLTPGAERLTTLQSNRYEYWRVAGRAFADHPVAGTGAGGWAVRWRAQRPFAEQARDAHSLYFETAAELGLIGLALLLTALGGVALAARDALRADRARAAGLAAVCAAWAAHVSLDWTWELPAATLPAVLAAGALLTAPRPPAAPPA